MSTLELLQKKIIEGKSILQDIECMRECGGPAINIVYYEHNDVKRCQKKIHKWQMTSKEILINAFGENHRHVLAFENTVSRTNIGFNYKEELGYEINQGLDVLEAIYEMLELKLEEGRHNQITKSLKKPMLFISHSSNDKDFVEALVDLFENIGFDKTTMFCSSIDGYGIALSEDIFENLWKLFNEYKLFVVFIHSPRYYNSTISLNEMGAAWVLKNDFCSFLTRDMNFSMMKGVVNNCTISIKVDADDAPHRLTELKDKLVRFFELPQIDNVKWNRKCQSFLEKVRAIQYESVTTVENECFVEQ